MVYWIHMTDNVGNIATNLDLVLLKVETEIATLLRWIFPGGLK